MNRPLARLPVRRLQPTRGSGYEPQWVRFEPSSGADITEGSGLWRNLPFTGEPATIDSVFAAARVRRVDTSRRNRFMRSDYLNFSSSAYFNLASADTPGSEGLVVTSGHSATATPFPASPDDFAAGFATLSSADEYILAFSACGSTGAMTGCHFKFGFENEAFRSFGVVNHPVTYPSSAVMTLLDTEVFCLFGDNYKFRGEAAWAWFHAASDASAYVDLSDQAQGARNFLLGDPEDWTLPTPLLHFQGPASEWNTGVNRGSGGNFTINVPVTDA